MQKILFQLYQYPALQPKNPGTANSERKKKYMAVCAAGRVLIIIIAGVAAVVVVGCEFGSRITAVGCLLEPDNVVFVYC